MTLPACPLRVVTPAAGVYFCRHERVHHPTGFVSEAKCGRCVWHHTPCESPRLVPLDMTTPVPLKSTSRLDCIHRGPELRREVCPTCSGSVQVKVFGCSLHASCSLAKQLDGVALCATCGDYSAP